MALPVVIVPGESVGPFKLGMSRAEVWAQDRSPIHAFFKTPMSKDRTDDVVKFGLHVYYDEDGRCDSIEAWTQTEHFHTTLLFGPHTLNGRSMKEVRDILKQSDIPFSQDAYGFTAPTIGLGFYCHDFESDEGSLDGIIIMKREPNQRTTDNSGTDCGR